MEKQNTFKYTKSKAYGLCGVAITLFILGGGFNIQRANADSINNGTAQTQQVATSTSTAGTSATQQADTSTSTAGTSATQQADTSTSTAGTSATQQADTSTSTAGTSATQQTVKEVQPSDSSKEVVKVPKTENLDNAVENAKNEGGEVTQTDTQKVKDEAEAKADYDKQAENINNQVAQHQKEIDEYNKQLAENEKNKDKDGYLSENLGQNLVFEQEKNAQLKVTSGQQRLTPEQAKADTEKNVSNVGMAQILGKLASDLAKEKQAYLLGKDKPLVAEYTVNNSRYKDQNINKVIITYTLKETTSKTGKVFVVIEQDPTNTFWYWDYYGSTKINVNAVFYDKDGKVIVPKDGLLSFSSLNATSNSYEYVSNFNGKYVAINGSTISEHGDSVYSSSSNSYKSEGAKWDSTEWDSSGNSKAYYGAIAGQIKDSINFDVGSEGRGLTWFKLNSQIQAFNVPTAPTTLKVNYHLNAYENNKPVTPTPEKPVTPTPEKPVTPTPEKPVTPVAYTPEKVNNIVAETPVQQASIATLPQTGDSKTSLFVTIAGFFTALGASALVFKKKKVNK